ncbi:hypothetical protein Patl1_07160 [Pistacia atlantica]|uniref:Uncharacterized protein n=1 Tax=Pistacia atlantica TaxID=434234 RepID=A0ACC1AJW2_9ROSI|nr:hypothetical protein Patl1_07160 [Pistacia atlantica]
MESSFHYSHPVGASDSNAGAELLDIILMKVIGEADFQRNRDLVKFSCRRRPGHVQSRNFSSFFVEWFDNCSVLIVNFHGSCPNPDCSYDLCLTCCAEIRKELRRHATFLIGEKRLTVEFLVLPKHMEVVMRGEPVIVTNVLEKTSGLSWDPMVMWSAFRGTKKILKEEACKVKAVDCFDWCEIILNPENLLCWIGLLNSKKFFHLKGKENLIRMLLWHGSWLTNFVGILSQGLRIAHPEAPATGYMVGKGIYFADLVSKSAQYCYIDKKNPVGLMLFSEVALGEVYTVKKAEVSSPSILHVYPNS